MQNDISAHERKKPRDLDSESCLAYLEEKEKFRPIFLLQKHNKCGKHIE